MKTTRLLLSVWLLCTGLIIVSAQGSADYQVVPLPDKICMQKGDPFVLDNTTTIFLASGDESLAPEARFLQEYVEDNTGISLQHGTSNKLNAITLRLDKNIPSAEGYRVTINQKGIIISGATAAGVFYGIQMLRKALPCDTVYQSISLAPVEINDAPRFGYRGMHLDVCRHFFGIDFVKEYIDLLVLHNMNTLHFHLTDDQGWRMEIKKSPKLTVVGANRTGTVLGCNSDVDDHLPYGGYFTQEQLREIVNYAAKRHITVIPEIEMPGHTLAILASYPEYGCTGGPYEVGHKWGIYSDILCAGKEETFNFLEDILDEVMDIFPSKYIHIGGDEAPKSKWEKCERCQQRIREEGIKATDKQSAENLLQGYFTRRINAYLMQHGRKLIGWDEIAECGIDTTATVMSWRGVEPGIMAAKMGHDVIMAPTTYCYFDTYQTADTYFEPKLIGGNISVEMVYGFEPVSEAVAPEDAKHILGVQANLWTEYIPVKQLAEYQILPRMAALSEVQWLAPANKDYQRFRQRLDKLTQLYCKYGFTYALHNWPEQYNKERSVF